MSGEVAVPATARLAATLGLRVFAARVTDDRRARGDDRAYADTTVRASPSASLAWRRDRLIVYARIASALRAGGVQLSSPYFTAGRYEADELIEGDLGHDGAVPTIAGPRMSACLSHAGRMSRRMC